VPNSSGYGEPRAVVKPRAVHETGYGESKYGLRIVLTRKFRGYGDGVHASSGYDDYTGDSDNNLNWTEEDEFAGYDGGMVPGVGLWRNVSKGDGSACGWGTLSEEGQLYW